MKIHLDYDSKLLTLENSVNLGDFINKIQSVLPDWEQWKINTTLNTVWIDPIRVYYPKPWWEQGYQYVKGTTSQEIGTIDNVQIDNVPDFEDPFSMPAACLYTLKVTEPSTGAYCIEI